ncbi:hypothetical protein BDC45DRAFT_56076 [Circinella umbellata]|nr:hypothetical protein BDC45DRAFT_56076 [Circinella umbellata]
MRGLVNIGEGKTEAEQSILFGLSKLPMRTMLDRVVCEETELWSSFFDPILSSVLSDPEKNVILRWSNVIPDEGSTSEFIQVRLDALICEIDQLRWGRTIGYGEVKRAEPTTNLDSLGQDIVRLALLTKTSLTKSKVNYVTAFQIHG